MSDFLSKLRLRENGTLSKIRSLSQVLQSHPIYHSINSIENVKTYMEHQVWCVWDFMTLLKSIQLRVTNTSLYWTPQHNANLGAYVYSILLSEETDISEFGNGYASHFETYLKAMEETGANSTSIKLFIDFLNQGKTPEVALRESDAPRIATEFVKNTLKFAESPLHITVAVFCLSRENIIPSLFKPLLRNLPPANNLSLFRWYLNRHIELDSSSHAPLSVKLFNEIVKNENQLVEPALQGAIEALEFRKAFLDGIKALMK